MQRPVVLVYLLPSDRAVQSGRRRGVQRVQPVNQGSTSSRAATSVQRACAASRVQRACSERCSECETRAHTLNTHTPGSRSDSVSHTTQRHPDRQRHTTAAHSEERYIYAPFQHLFLFIKDLCEKLRLNRSQNIDKIDSRIFTRI